jgi:hypothetical protein
MSQPTSKTAADTSPQMLVIVHSIRSHLTPPWLSFFSMLAADSRSAAAFITLHKTASNTHACRLC